MKKGGQIKHDREAPTFCPTCQSWKTLKHFIRDSRINVNCDECRAKNPALKKISDALKGRKKGEHRTVEPKPKKKPELVTHYVPGNYHQFVTESKPVLGTCAKPGCTNPIRNLPEYLLTGKEICESCARRNEATPEQYDAAKRAMNAKYQPRQRDVEEAVR
jgi:hypothetical protein